MNHGRGAPLAGVQLNGTGLRNVRLAVRATSALEQQVCDAVVAPAKLVYLVYHVSLATASRALAALVRRLQRLGKSADDSLISKVRAAGPPPPHITALVTSPLPRSNA